MSKYAQFAQVELARVYKFFHKLSVAGLTAKTAVKLTQKYHTQGAVWFTEADELAFHEGSPLPVYCAVPMERHQSEPQLSRTRCELYRSLLEGMLKTGINASWDGKPQSPILVSRH